MSRPNRDSTGVDATSLDLRDYSDTLARVLPHLLFTRDRDALLRWCRVRSWVDNAITKEPAPDLITIELAVAYLVECAADSRGAG